MVAPKIPRDNIGQFNAGLPFNAYITAGYVTSPQQCISRWNSNSMSQELTPEQSGLLAMRIVLYDTQ